MHTLENCCEMVGVTCAWYYIHRCNCSHSSHNALHSLVHYLLQANTIHKLSKSTAIQPLKVGVMVRMAIITGDRLSLPAWFEIVDVILLNIHKNFNPSHAVVL